MQKTTNPREEGTIRSAWEHRFGRRHVVLPVIHVTGQEQALRNATIAFEAGADGIFLINHTMGHAGLLRIHKAVVAEFPGRWVGVNCLDLTPPEVFALVDESVGGVWVDNAFIDETRADQPMAERLLAAREKSAWHGLYFGGVAFKGQRRVSDLEQAAITAARYMDVVTTSGPGTGLAADTTKIARMKAALGMHPLAIASGITPENVHEYLPHADCFLVATGISRTFDGLDPARVGALVRTVRGAATVAPEGVG